MAKDKKSSSDTGEHETRKKPDFVVESSQEIFPFLKKIGKTLFFLGLISLIILIFREKMGQEDSAQSTQSAPVTREQQTITRQNQELDTAAECGGKQNFEITKVNWTLIEIGEGCRLIGTFKHPILWKGRSGEERLLIPGDRNSNITGRNQRLEFKLPDFGPESPDKIELALEFKPATRR